MATGRVALSGSSAQRPCLSSNSSVAFRVEDELRQAGLRLCAADELMEESFGTLVLRRVNAGIARSYHHELMVKSHQGQETSTRQGWHTGSVALSPGIASSPPTAPTPTRRAAGSTSALRNSTPCGCQSCGPSTTGT
ncbi:MAG: hypothetical protein ACYCYQ_10700 [Acidimicrobiales bacterium]